MTGSVNTAAGASPDLLEIESVSLRFGGLTAVNSVSLSVRRGEIYSVIGPNGAGKTSLFNAITGVYQPASGTIRFKGKETILPAGLIPAAGCVVFGVVVGFSLLLLVYAQSFWTAAITDNYVYQMPFPWKKSVKSALLFFWRLPLLESMLPLLSGLLIGTFGSLAVWNRSRRTPDTIARFGIGRTFQNIRLFHQMTAVENVLVGMDSRLRSRWWDIAFRLPPFFRERRRALRKAHTLLDFVELGSDAETLAAELPYGHRRRLEIARALASQPELLLLDEPAAGMNPAESIELMALIQKIKTSGVTVLLIEHHMRVVMGVSDRIAVLDYGNKIAEGTPEEIRRDPRVIEAYLGKEEHR